MPVHDIDGRTHNCVIYLACIADVVTNRFDAKANQCILTA